MIELVAGDLLESRADMLVNAVNCVGVMGAGIALAFRQRWPVMFDDYRRVCRAGDLRPGRIHVWLAPDGTRIVNLPTKRHWRDASRYADVEAGLAALCGCIERFAPSSVAVPALGCGHGGLDWPRVASMIYAHLAETDARILVHGPDVSTQGAHTSGRRGREAAHRPRGRQRRSLSIHGDMSR